MDVPLWDKSSTVSMASVSVLADQLVVQVLMLAYSGAKDWSLGRPRTVA